MFDLARPRPRPRRRSVIVVSLLIAGLTACASAPPLTADHVICLSVPGATGRQFLVGGYHLPLDLDVALGPNLKAAVEASDRVVFETFRTGTAEESAAIAKAGRRIDQLDPPLAADLDQTIDQTLRAGHGGRSIPWREQSPIDVSVLLARLIGGAGGTSLDRLRPSLDEQIRTYSQSKDKPLGRLESPVEQFRLVSTVPSTADWEQTFRQQLIDLRCEGCARDAVARTRRLMISTVEGHWPEVDEAVQGNALADHRILRPLSKIRDPVIASRMLARARNPKSGNELFVIGASHVTPVLEHLRSASVAITDNCRVDGRIFARPLQ